VSIDVSTRCLLYATHSATLHLFALLADESDQRLITAQKHHAVQEVMIDHVYLGDRSPTLVEELGFEPTDLGYVKLQWLMSEHQGDALIAQYIQGGMMKMLEAAELNLSDLQSNSDEAINQ